MNNNPNSPNWDERPDELVTAEEWHAEADRQRTEALRQMQQVELTRLAAKKSSQVETDRANELQARLNGESKRTFALSRKVDEQAAEIARLREMLYDEQKLSMAYVARIEELTGQQQ
jgi:hypothetical protein